MNINKDYLISELEYLQFRSGNVAIVSLEVTVILQRRREYE